MDFIRLLKRDSGLISTCLLPTVWAPIFDLSQPVLTSALKILQSYFLITGTVKMVYYWILSQTGIKFLCLTFGMLCTGVKLEVSITYHPQTNGSSEQVNKMANQSRHSHVDRQQQGWVCQGIIFRPPKPYPATSSWKIHQIFWLAGNCQFWCYPQLWQ